MKRRRPPSASTRPRPIATPAGAVSTPSATNSPSDTTACRSGFRFAVFRLRKQVIHQPRRGVPRPPGQAARTELGLTRERHQPFVPALRASQSREPVTEQPTVEMTAKLVLDERRVAVAPRTPRLASARRQRREVSTRRQMRGESAIDSALSFRGSMDGVSRTIGAAAPMAADRVFGAETGWRSGHQHAAG